MNPIPLAKTSFSRISSSRYSTSVFQSQSSQLLPLSQSHDPGWVAFPGWRFWERFEQVKYNGWANGWLIPGNAASAAQANATDGESEVVKVTILYWPQLLSYAGYGLLIATLLWLGVGAWRERSSSNSVGADKLMYAERGSGRAMGGGEAGRDIADNTSGSTGGVAKPGDVTPTPHFTPLSIEKLFTGGSLGAEFNREWQLFQKEVVTNTLLISHDLQSAWHRLQQAVRNVLRGRKS